MSIIIFIIILGILIFVHELGHFLAAKKTGMLVEEFAIGFRPAIFKKQKGETKYILGVIPIGGYVKIFGENPDDIENFSQKEQNNIKRAFFSKKRPAQALVISMGVIFNIIFAWFLLSTALTIGAPVVINESNQEYIVSKIKTPEAIQEIRKDLKLEFGIAQMPIHQAVYHGAKTTGNYLILTIIGFKDFLAEIFTGEADMDKISGPVGIVKHVSNAAESGFVSLILFTAIISINLAVINFLPFPALDGGRFIFIIIESIIRRPIKPVIFNTINIIGFSLLILLMLFVTYHDIIKLFN